MRKDPLKQKYICSLGAILTRAKVIEVPGGFYVRLYPPEYAVRRLQRALAYLVEYWRLVAARYRCESVPHLGVPGRTRLTCLAAHVGRPVTVIVRLKLGYESINRKPLYSCVRDVPWPPGGERLDAQRYSYILVHKPPSSFREVLARGLPTSNVMFNISLAEFDGRLNTAMLELPDGGVYTRRGETLYLSGADDRTLLGRVQELAGLYGLRLDAQAAKVVKASRNGVRTFGLFALGDSGLQLSVQGRKRLRQLYKQRQRHPTLLATLERYVTDIEYLLSSGVRSLAPDVVSGDVRGKSRRKLCLPGE